MDTKLIDNDITDVAVLERCNFVWILNKGSRERDDRAVLERCNFVWILN